MHTQGHALVNLALLGGARRRNVAALVGAVLPDLAIAAFYLDERFRRGTLDAQIWASRYFTPGTWPNVIDALHSIPLAVALFLVAKWRSAETLAVLALGLVLHSLCDLPLHGDDAHRHFYPFSDAKWVSPWSYWQTGPGFTAELIVVTIAAATLWTRYGRAGRAGVGLLVAIYFVGLRIG